MRTCKWCKQPFDKPKIGSICNRCAAMCPLLPRFVKARDDLRELLGLERMGRTDTGDRH